MRVVSLYVCVFYIYTATFNEHEHIWKEIFNIHINVKAEWKTGTDEAAEMRNTLFQMSKKQTDKKKDCHEEKSKDDFFKRWLWVFFTISKSQQDKNILTLEGVTHIQTMSLIFSWWRWTLNTFLQNIKGELVLKGCSHTGMSPWKRSVDWFPQTFCKHAN